MEVKIGAAALPCGLLPYRAVRSLPNRAFHGPLIGALGLAGLGAGAVRLFTMWILGSDRPTC